MFLCLRETILLLRLRELDLFHNLKMRIFTYMFMYISINKYIIHTYLDISIFTWSFVPICFYVYVRLFCFYESKKRRLRSVLAVVFGATMSCLDRKGQ